MSEKRESRVVSGGGNTSNLHSPSFFHHVSRRAGILAAVAVLAIVGLAGYQYYRPHAHTNGVSKSAQQTVNQAVSKSVEHPDYATATSKLQDEIEATKDSKKKADLYVALASLAQQQGKYQAVVDNEIKVIELNPSREGEQSLTLAGAYKQLGSKPEALQYYQKALAYYQSKPANFSGRAYYIATVQSKITELSK